MSRNKVINTAIKNKYYRIQVSRERNIFFEFLKLEVLYNILYFFFNANPAKKSVRNKQNVVTYRMFMKVLRNIFTVVYHNASRFSRIK